MKRLYEFQRWAAAPAILAALVLCAAPARMSASVIFYSGDLRTDATVTACGADCTLGPSNLDSDYAQWAAVVYTFQVTQTTPMEAITYSYGGGTSLTGVDVPAGGLEPYLSLFDASGDFLASTFFGVTCPPGANSVSGNCYDVELDGGTLNPGAYEIALTDFENMSYAENLGPPYTLSDGFTGLGSLQPGENLNYAFDVILSAQTQTTPEPGSLTMLLSALLAFVLAKRVLRSKSTN